MQKTAPSLSDRLQPPSRFSGSEGSSVWLEFSPLAALKKAINLGQGFPSWSPPKFVTEAALASLSEPVFAQYARSSGHLPLVEAIAEHYQSKLGREIQAESEVLVTAGCSEAIFLALMALVDSGDEVILLEPAFDIYKGAISMLGGKAVGVHLDLVESGDDFSLQLDPDKLRQSMSDQTKVLILNSPHNPSGKVWTHEELKELALVLVEFPNVTVLSDEVYEYILHGAHEHLSIAAMEGMQERCISMYSAGKTFSITGWKIGWAIGPSDLILRMQQCQQWVMFSVSTPLQEAVAVCLSVAQQPFENHANYYSFLKSEYEIRYELLKGSLQAWNVKLCRTQGSFFHMVQLPEELNSWLIKPPENYLEFAKKSGFAVNYETLNHDDYNLCRHLSIDAGVTAIPVSAFYSKRDEHTPKRMLRFAFCKSKAELIEAGRRLADFPLNK